MSNRGVRVVKTERSSIRRYDIDWLRIFAMGMVFLFHCARFFNNEGWHVKNDELSLGMSVFVMVVGQWTMPLFFVLSAESASFSLAKRDNGHYIREKCARLLLPLLVGILFLAPPQVYVERLTHGDFSGSFLQFLPHYFDGFYAFGGNFAWMGLHLWYLEILFLFSLLTLPLFRLLSRRVFRERIARIAAYTEKRGTIFLAALPLGVLEALANMWPEGIGIRAFGGWSPLVYLGLFVLGFLFALDERFQRRAEKEWKTGLVLGILATVAGIVLSTGGYSSRSVPFAFLRTFNCWCWLVALLGFAGRFCTFENAFLCYANKAVLPFYMLHQPVIVLTGFLLMHAAMGVAAKYAILAATSFAVVMVLFEWGIRRHRVSRVFFGMKA